MRRAGAFGGLAALAAAAASAAAPGPIVTRGSGALSPGCRPAEAALAVVPQAPGARVIYVVVIPDRQLRPRAARFEAGLDGETADEVLSGTIDCAAGTLGELVHTAHEPFTDFGGCPAPKHFAGELVACAAPPSAWETSSDFRARTMQAASGRCSTASVRTRIVSALRAFDFGRADTFAAAFAVRAAFQPYSASLRAPVRGRSAIRRFAARRIAAVDGWTATGLVNRGRGSFALALVGYANGRLAGAGTARLRIDCRTGLIAWWVGPELPLPS
jgi:hypothetical protein